MDSVKAQEVQENTSMVENSKPLVKKEKPHTTPDAVQSLEILTSVIETCRNAGIDVQVGPFHDQGKTATVVILWGIKIIDGRLVKVL